MRVDKNWIGLPSWISFSSRKALAATAAVSTLHLLSLSHSLCTFGACVRILFQIVNSHGIIYPGSHLLLFTVEICFCFIFLSILWPLPFHFISCHSFNRCLRACIWSLVSKRTKKNGREREWILFSFFMLALSTNVWIHRHFHRYQNEWCVY